MIDYVLSHTNRTTGWIGPFLNEPGDPVDSHGPGWIKVKPTKSRPKPKKK